jgi:hypothetical protein
MFLVMAMPVSGVAGATESGWQGTTPIGWYSGTTLGKAMAINPAGEILAVMVMWKASNEYYLVSSRFLPGQGWSPLSDMASTMAPISHVVVTADGIGNFWASYSIELSDTAASLTAGRFSDSVGWGNWTSLQYQEGYRIEDVAMAADSAGNLMVTWVKGATSFPWAREMVAQPFTIASGWGSVASVYTPTESMLYDLTLAVQNGGGAAVAWTESVEGTNRLLTSRYVPHFGWSEVEVLISQPTNLELVHLGFNENGVGLIAWAQGNSPRQVYSKSYNNSAWQPSMLAASDDLMGMVEMAMNPAGQAMLTWINNSYSNVMKCATYVPVQGWSTSRPVFEIEAGLNFIFASLNLAANGHALLIYEKGDGPTRDKGFFSRGFALSTWGPETPIMPSDLYSHNPVVAFGSQGMAVLSRDNLVMNNMIPTASVYIPSHLPAPGLHVVAPTSGTTSGVGTVHVLGSTDPGARISVNGIDAYVNNAGAFDVVVPLAPGDNVLTITATGAYGNSQSTSIPVKYVDAAQQQMQNDINKLNGQGTLYLLLGLIALIVAVVAIVLLLLRRKP